MRCALQLVKQGIRDYGNTWRTQKPQKDGDEDESESAEAKQLREDLGEQCSSAANQMFVCCEPCNGLERSTVLITSAVMRKTLKFVGRSGMHRTVTFIGLALQNDSIANVCCITPFPFSHLYLVSSMAAIHQQVVGCGVWCSVRSQARGRGDPAIPAAAVCGAGGHRTGSRS